MFINTFLKSEFHQYFIRRSFFLIFRFLTDRIEAIGEVLKNFSVKLRMPYIKTPPPPCPDHV